MEGRNRIQNVIPDKDVSILSSIFSLEDVDKVVLSNLVQYVTLSIIPILVILKELHEYVPEEDDEKSSIEITFEVLIEVIGIVISLWFINRVILHIPTYSGKAYPPVSIFSSMLPFVFILTTIQSKFSKKVNILFERLYVNQSKEREQAPQPRQMVIAPPINVHSKMDDNQQPVVHHQPEQPVYNRMPPPQNEPMASNESVGEYSSW